MGCDSDDESLEKVRARRSSEYDPGEEGIFYWDGESTKGTVWGSGPYTAHSNIVLAALHAGAVERGKAGRQYFRVSRVDRPVLLFTESEHFGVISKPCGYHADGAIEVDGTKFGGIRKIRDFVATYVEPLLPDIGIDMLFDSVSMALPSAASDGEKKHRAATKCLCYVDTARMKTIMDKVNGHPDESTEELQSWYKFMVRVRSLLREEESEELMESGAMERRRVFLFRLAWTETADHRTESTIDVETDVRVERAGPVDFSRLVVTFLVGMALAFVPIVDVLSDMATTAEFYVSSNYTWFYASVAILVNSARFVTAFHVVDPEPNWGNLGITIVPFAHIFKLPFISDVEVKERDKTQMLSKKFSASAVDHSLLADKTALKAATVRPVATAPQMLAGLFHEDSLPLNFYELGAFDDGGDGEDVVPFHAPVDEPTELQACHHDDHPSLHTTGVERTLQIAILQPKEQDAATPHQVASQPSGGAIARSSSYGKFALSHRVGHDGPSFRHKRKSIVPSDMPEVEPEAKLIGSSPMSPLKSSVNLASSLRRSHNVNTNAGETFQDKIVLPLRKVYNAYVEEHSSRWWTRPIVGLMFEMFLIVVCIPVSSYVMLANALEVTYALIQQRFIGRGEDEPDDIIQRRRHQGVVLSFAEAVSETLPQLMVQVRAYSIGALDPLLFFISGSITFVSVLKSIVTFILQFEDILQLSDSQKILQRSLANDPKQADVWMTLGRFGTAVVLGKELSPAACNMESSYYWAHHFLELRHRKDESDRHVTLRGQRYEHLQCFINAVKGWCRAMALHDKYGDPFTMREPSAYRKMMSKGWFHVASCPIEQLQPYVETWFTRRECFQAALELDDSNARAWLGLAKCDGGVVDDVQCDAIMCLKEALHRDENLEEAYFELGVALCNLEDVDSVTLYDLRVLSRVQCFAEALSRNPKCAKTLLELGKCLPSSTAGAHVKGFLEPLDKRTCFVCCLQFDANSDEAYYLLGMTLLELKTDTRVGGEPVTAKVAFIRALSLNPKRTNAYFQLGKLLTDGEEVVCGGRTLTNKLCFAEAIGLGDCSPCVYYALALAMSPVDKVMVPSDRPSDVPAGGLARRKSTKQLAALQTTVCLSKLQCFVLGLVSVPNDEELKFNAVALHYIGRNTPSHEVVNIAGLWGAMTPLQCLAEACTCDPSVAEYFESLGDALDRPPENGELCSVELGDGRRVVAKDCYVESAKLDLGRVSNLGKLAQRMEPGESIVLCEDAPAMGKLDVLAQLLLLVDNPSDCLVQLGKCLAQQPTSAARVVTTADGTSLSTPRDCFVEAIAKDVRCTEAYLCLADCLTNSEEATVTIPRVGTLTALDCYRTVFNADMDVPISVFLSLAKLMHDGDVIHLSRGNRNMTRKNILTTALSQDEESGEAYDMLWPLLHEDEVVVLDSGVTIGRLECFLRMIELEHNMKRAYFALGQHLEKHRLEHVDIDGETLSVEDIYLEAIACAPRFAFAEAYCALGRVKAASHSAEETVLPDGTRADATKCFLHAIASDPHFGTAFYFVGESLGRLERVQLPPTLEGDSFTVTVAGREVSELSRSECLQYALACDPSLGEAYLALSELLVLDETVQIGQSVFNKKQLVMQAITCGKGTAVANGLLSLSKYYDDLPAGASTVELPTGRVLTQQECLLEAVAADEEHGDSYYELGQFLLKHQRESVRLLNGTSVQPKDCFVLSVERDPSNSAAYASLCDLLGADEIVTLRSGQRITKRDALMEAVGPNPTDEGAMRTMLDWMQDDEVKLKNGDVMTRTKLLVHILLVTSSNVASTYMELGNTLLRTRQPFVALRSKQMTPLECFKEAVKAAPATAKRTVIDALLRIGECMDDKDTITIADGHHRFTNLSRGQCFVEAIALAPKEPMGYAMLAKTLSSLRFPVKLKDNRSLSQKACCLEALQRDPNCATAFYALGLTLKDGATIAFNGRKLSRTDCFVEAVRVSDGGSSEAYVALGQSLETPSAEVLVGTTCLTQEDCFRNALEIDPQNADALIGTGRVLADRGTVNLLGKTLLKKDCFVEAIVMRPASPFAYYYLGEVLHQQATKQQQSGASVNAQLPTAKLRDGRTMYALQCFVETIKLMDGAALDEHIMTSPLYAAAYYHLGLCLSPTEKDKTPTVTLPHNDRTLNAKDCFLYAISRNPNYAEPYYAVACLCVNPSGTAASDMIRLLTKDSKQRDLISPRECIVKAIELKPSWGPPYAKLGAMLGMTEVEPIPDGSGGTRRLSKRDCLVKAIELDPKCGLAFYHLGRVLGSQGHATIGGTSLGSRACYLKAINLSRTLWAAYYHLGCLMNDTEVVNLFGAQYLRADLMKFKEKAFQAE